MADCINNINGEPYSMPKLGTLERVALRDVWKNEASHFTPWLALPENLKILATTLNLEQLELEAQEKNVGPFRADILCKSTDDGSWVLIENQLERTDHTHLGQLLTYASGLQAVTIAWIAERFTEEHRSVLDWLNDITDDQFRFFGLEIELWRIGNSFPAPKFNIVSKPNDWTRSISKAAQRISDSDTTETKQLQWEFWSQLTEYLQSKNSSVRMHKPKPQHWMTGSIGRAGFHLSATLNTMENWLSVMLVINDDKAKAFFNLLHEDKEAIEEDLGHRLSWRELREKKSSRICIYREDQDPLNKQNWPDYLEWFKNMLELFDKVFRIRIAALDASAWQPKDDEDIS